MSIAVDPSTPARANGGVISSSVATAVFNPPASVLIATIASNGNADGGGPTFGITNNGVGLAWNLIALRNDTDGINGGAAAYYAILPAARTGMTVTGSTTYVEPSLKVYVLTGVDTADVLGGFTEGSSTATSSFTTGAFTIARAGSLGFVACSQWEQAAPAPTSSDTTYDNRDGFSMGALAGYKALGAAAGSASFNLNGNASPSTINWVSFEIQAAPAVAPPPPGNVWRRRRMALRVR